MSRANEFGSEQMLTDSIFEWLCYWPKNRIFKSQNSSFEFPPMIGYDQLIMVNTDQLTFAAYSCGARDHLHILVHSCGMFFYDLFTFEGECAHEFWSIEATKSRVFSHLIQSVTAHMIDGHIYYARKYKQNHGGKLNA